MQRYGITATKKYTLAERRRKMIAYLHEHPGVTQAQLGFLFGVDRSTISRDLKDITEELKIHNRETYTLHQQRVVREIQANKELCMEKLRSLKDSPHQGSRWMEEWRGLVKLEAQMLGIKDPDRMLLGETQEFTKEEEDAAVNAAALSFEDTVIDITPKLPAPKLSSQEG